MSGESMTDDARVVIPSPDGSFELRQLVPGDAEEYHRLLAESRQDAEWARKGAEVADKYTTVEQARASIEHPQDPTRLRFGIWHIGENGDELVGSVNISPYGSREDAMFETGSWVGARFQGQGYITRARNLMAGYAFQRLGARKLVSFIDADNPRSIRSVTNSGYAPTEMEGEYELTREAYNARQAV